MVIMVAPAGGEDLRVSLLHTVVTTEVQGLITQGHVLQMDPMDRTGEEKT